MSDDRPILDGVKVLDVGTWVFGPASTTVMADFGADVIKVEHPTIGDAYRYLHLMPPMPVCSDDYCFLVDGRNKRSIALDLSRSEGREVLHRMVRDADVFETNYHPSVLAKLGLTYEELSALNPRLVYAQASGYGEAGEEVEKPGFDATAWWARSGMMDAVHAFGAEPSLPMPAMGDRPSSMALFGAVMLALYERHTTGKGAKVSSSLMANGAWANACMIQAVLSGADDYDPIPRLETPNAVANIYPTSDDRWILLALVNEDRDWNGLCLALDREDLLETWRFLDTEQRRAHARELAAILDEEFRSRDLDHWRDVLDEHDVTFGIVARTDEVPDDAQMLANDVLVPFAEGEGSALTVNSPIWVEGRDKVKPRRAPAIGEHTEEVLAELGYDAAAIVALREIGAIPS